MKHSVVFYSPCYSPCAASLVGIPPGGIGLSRLVHEKRILVYLSLSNLLLNALMIVALTASWSNWFHLFKTLLEMSLLLSRAHLTLTNLREWPLVPLPLSPKWKCSSDLILFNPLHILNTCIKTCLFLLSSTDHKFNFCNLSSYDLPFIPFIIFVNVHWTFSNNSLSFL